MAHTSQSKQKRADAARRELGLLLQKHGALIRVMQNGDLCIEMGAAAYNMPAGSYRRADGSVR